MTPLQYCGGFGLFMAGGEYFMDNIIPVVIPLKYICMFNNLT